MRKKAAKKDSKIVILFKIQSELWKLWVSRLVREYQVAFCITTPTATRKSHNTAWCPWKCRSLFFNIKKYEKSDFLRLLQHFQLASVLLVCVTSNQLLRWLKQSASWVIWNELIPFCCCCSASPKWLIYYVHFSLLRSDFLWCLDFCAFFLVRCFCSHRRWQSEVLEMWIITRQMNPPESNSVIENCHMRLSCQHRKFNIFLLRMIACLLFQIDNRRDRETQSHINFDYFPNSCYACRQINNGMKSW